MASGYPQTKVAITTNERSLQWEEATRLPNKEGQAEAACRRDSASNQKGSVFNILEIDAQVTIVTKKLHPYGPGALAPGPLHLEDNIYSIGIDLYSNRIYNIT